MRIHIGRAKDIQGKYFNFNLQWKNTAVLSLSGTYKFTIGCYFLLNVKRKQAGQLGLLVLVYIAPYYRSSCLSCTFHFLFSWYFSYPLSLFSCRFQAECRLWAWKCCPENCQLLVIDSWRIFIIDVSVKNWIWTIHNITLGEKKIYEDCWKYFFSCQNKLFVSETSGQNPDPRGSALR